MGIFWRAVLRELLQALCLGVVTNVSLGIIVVPRIELDLACANQVTKPLKYLSPKGHILRSVYGQGSGYGYSWQESETDP